MAKVERCYRLEWGSWIHYLLLGVSPESPRPLGLAPQNNLCSSWRDIRPIIDMTVGKGSNTSLFGAAAGKYSKF